MNRPDGEARPLLNGVRQWVKVAGAAHGTVPLVVLHGGPGGNHFVFERVAGPGLEAARTVVYHEQRGSGRSDPPEPADAYSMPLLTADLRSLLDWLGAEQADLLGYSFGGGLALEFARACPERVRRLVLQAPALHLRDPEVTASQLAGFAEVAQGDVGTRVQALLREARSPEEQLERVWRVVDTPTVDRFLFQRADVAARNRALWAESGLTNSGAMHRALAAQPPTGTAPDGDHGPHPDSGGPARLERAPGAAGAAGGGPAGRAAARVRCKRALPGPGGNGWVRAGGPGLPGLTGRLDTRTPTPNER
ncbi:alpha/beta fold hydrolase [Deinococcus ficus]|uniref:alpha/beta fold hydrolase n=1 Tax=Deinococcus ficus TaxID=317577 RepID=UPI001749471C|nr:alpha/beta fold hydrolase [Deinococcus ficus]GHF71778.1 hypothetical protein GCM10017782_06690 [Deinococcus ficus]